MSTVTALPPTNEAAFASAVLALLHLHGWRTYRTWLSVHSPAGFPDVVACHPERGLVFLELKSDTGRLTHAQADWLNALELAGARCHVLKPRDWDVIQAIARGEA
jgi:VRR-NUC domain